MIYKSLFEGKQFVLICKCGGDGRIERVHGRLTDKLIIKCSNCSEIKNLDDLLQTNLTN